MLRQQKRFSPTVVAATHNQVTGIPYTKRVVQWFGNDAKFIAANIKL